MVDRSRWWRTQGQLIGRSESSSGWESRRHCSGGAVFETRSMPRFAAKATTLRSGRLFSSTT